MGTQAPPPSPRSIQKFNALEISSPVPLRTKTNGRDLLQALRERNAWEYIRNAGFGSPDSQTLKAYIDTKSEGDFHDEEEVGQLSQIGSGNTGMFSRLLETAYESVNVMLSPSTKAKKYCAGLGKAVTSNEFVPIFSDDGDSSGRHSS